MTIFDEARFLFASVTTKDEAVSVAKFTLPLAVTWKILLPVEEARENKGLAGLVEVPCVRRNAMGAVNALTSAEMALSGQKSVFSADQVIETMGNVGRRLPEEFRETARGGLALLPCAGCSSQSSRS